MIKIGICLEMYLKVNQLLGRDINRDHDKDKDMPRDVP
jgi:hypothetical protein